MGSGRVRWNRTEQNKEKDPARAQNAVQVKSSLLNLFWGWWDESTCAGLYTKCISYWA